MPVTGKRARAELEAEEPATQWKNQDSPQAVLLRRIRNTWCFANLYQWIQVFGSAVKIDERMDIEVGCTRVAWQTTLPAMASKLRSGQNSLTW
jgi:hypothetical protein